MSYETIPGLGYVDEVGVMNPQMVAAAQTYNGKVRDFSLKAGAPYPVNSAQFAKAVFSLQQQIYSSCSPLGPISRGLGGTCGNVDGKLGPNTAAALRGAGTATGNFDASRLVASATQGGMEALDAQEIADAAAALGINPKPRRQPAPAPAPAPRPGPRPGPRPAPKPKAEEGGTNMWVIVGAAAVGIGVLYYMSKRKK